MKRILADIRQRLMQDWNLMRFIRLGLALVISYEAFKNYDWVFAVLGALLMVQSLLNVGCCAAGGCDTGVPVKGPDKKPLDETTFEEIK